MIEREQLLECKIFTGLDIEELDSVLSCGRDVVFQNGEIILEESSIEEASDLFFIESGMVKVELEKQQSEDSGKTIKRLAILKNGDVFGEMGLLKGNRRSARVAAYGAEVRAIRFSSRKLYAMFENYNHIGYLVMHNLASILSDRLVDVNFMWRDDI